MATKESIERLALRVWPNAKNISVHPGAAGSTSGSDPDPQGYQLTVTDSHGEIKTISAASLDELKAKVHELHVTLKPRGES